MRWLLRSAILAGNLCKIILSKTSSFDHLFNISWNISLIAFPFYHSFQIDLILQVWNLSGVLYNFSLTLTLSLELAIFVMITKIAIINISIISIIVLTLTILIIIIIIKLKIIILTHLLTTWNSCLQCLWLATASSSQCRRPLAPWSPLSSSTSSP